MNALNSSAFPPGRSWGQRWLLSLPIKLVTAVGVPPPAATRQMPAPTVGVNRIVSSTSHFGADCHVTAPDTSETVTGVPPLRRTFISRPRAENPSHWLSGEKNGLLPPSVPGIGVLLN